MPNRLQSGDTEGVEVTEVPIDRVMLNNAKFYCDGMLQVIREIDHMRCIKLLYDY